MIGSVLTSITLDSLPELSLNVDLLVLENDQSSIDLLLGRDFFQCNKLSVLYNPSSKEQQTLRLFSEVALTEIVTENFKNKTVDLSEIETDVGYKTNSRVLAIIKEVEDTEVAPIVDDYTVTVTLKDDSTYAYAPRRFAWSERVQIREVTDDLLNRGIIKPSISPYCARVVPVEKRNGTLRLCVDLRPLNARVAKQKYPFPLIEDCLARLSNKKIFTLLDLKDGFHQIKAQTILSISLLLPQTGNLNLTDFLSVTVRLRPNFKKG